MKADEYKPDYCCCLQQQLQQISHAHRCNPVLGTFSERLLSAEKSGTMLAQDSQPLLSRQLSS